ncbi:MAG: methyltransferase [Phycisphaerales bacterium JB039]
MQRLVTPEMMDDPEARPEDLQRSLAFIRIVNSRLGGVHALLTRLRRWSARWPRSRPIRLLDVGTGSADIPAAAAEWAARAGHDLQITAVDLHPATLAAAADYLDTRPEARQRIQLEQHDALRLMDRFQPGAFDYAHAGMFLHHLPEIEVLTVLRIMDRLASAGVIWNDLLRSRLVLAATKFLTARQPEMVRHDACASVQAGFRAREALDIARRVGLDYCTVRANLLQGRFVVAGEKPGAWTGHPPTPPGANPPGASETPHTPSPP